ncbi:whirlin-like [Oncorhynchus kisutch]|uniref:whirlin-like n=1 Tax=Oncorhynchus kisutch TaxID=8019 RepID=UPI0012DE9B56|nr:whirlin-like [Oncorhynchus kisutch]
MFHCFNGRHRERCYLDYSGCVLHRVFPVGSPSHRGSCRPLAHRASLATKNLHRRGLIERHLHPPTYQPPPPRYPSTVDSPTELTEDPLANCTILYQMVALCDYAAEGPEDLEFSEGDTIDILSEEACPCPDSFSTTADGTAPLSFMQGEAVGEIREVTLRRSKSNEGLGFSIRGGSEHGVGIYVSLVEPGSFAENEGLRVGDQIVTVNGMLFDRVSHMEAVKVLKGCKKLAMSVCSVGRIPGGYVTNNIYAWVDPHGRSVSPPSDLEQQSTLGPQHSQRRTGHTQEKTVNLNLDDGLSLGLMIRGGAEYGLGIYITGVDPGSAADHGALKVGDQLLEVNGRSFVAIPHDEAVRILKTCRHLLVRVRDVGRVPHARTVVDQTKWISSPITPSPPPITESTASPAATR